MKANDDYLAGRVPDFKERKQYSEEISPAELVQKQLDTNFRIMEQIRARVDAIVVDPVTAEALKPYYPYGCKRPTFHDEYLPTFNKHNVHLVDTAPRGVSKINERGVVQTSMVGQITECLILKVAVTPKHSVYLQKQNLRYLPQPLNLQLLLKIWSMTKKLRN